MDAKDTAAAETPVSAITPCSVESLSASLAQHFDISSHLLRHHGFVSLPHAYECYKAFNIAHDEMETMTKNRTWEGKPPLKVDLMEVFACRSTFYNEYLNLFDQVEDYPMLKRWLEQEHGARTGPDLFGGRKRSYAFRDLRDYFIRIKPGREAGQLTGKPVEGVERKRKAVELLAKATKKEKTAVPAAKTAAKAGGSG
jgi:hypothetical protein